MPEGRILLSVPHMGGAEQTYIDEAFRTNWLSTVGPNLDAFEHAFQQRLGRPCVALSSGTAAIHLGLRLLGVGPGDEVFCPTLTFAGSCNPIRYLGAAPVFLDSEAATWNLDPNQLETALRDRARGGHLPRAVIVVHLYGQCADMGPILDLCRRYEVPVLEDAAQALGATYDGHPAGAFGDVAAFSFNGNKIITTTGGGMLVCAKESWAEKARFWSQQAREPGSVYLHAELGYNYRMSNVLAGIGRGQLEVLDLRIRQRRAIAARYREAFADLPGIVPMPDFPRGCPTNWLSTFLLDEAQSGCSRDALIAALDQDNIESRPVWKPMHLQPMYEGCECYGGTVAEGLFRRGFSLPSSSSLSPEDQLRVINAVRRAAGARAVQRPSELPDLRPPQAHSDSIQAPRRAISQSTNRIQHLLGRSPNQISSLQAEKGIEGHIVLVTGAAGSIGAELCRQLARHRPAAIIAFDLNESALFEAELAFRREFTGVPYEAELGNAQHQERVEELLSRYKPGLLFHAAAYKHVPMLESHLIEAVENNVFGTLELARAAVRHGVSAFVLISSDKAVRPASVMGATKRLAEMAVQSLPAASTSLITVRFGNVLGSRASVLPIFEQQIANGGPVTLTHPDMQRYFMTNAEACHLILVAAGLGGNGQTFLLDMGDPVRIVDLAQRMIESAGPDARFVRIEYTGVRPGEKLAEQLFEDGEQPVPTGTEGIRVLSGSAIVPPGLLQSLDALRSACHVRDARTVLNLLQSLVPHFEPGEFLLQQMEARAQSQKA